jgi:uncharacterized membrane protein YfcA
MNKAIITISLTVFSIVGGYIPYLWGDDNFFGGWSLLLGALGAFFGIWVGVWINKRIG